MLMTDNIPQIIKDVGFDFSWSEEKVWALDVPVEEMAIEELVHGNLEHLCLCSPTSLICFELRLLCGVHPSHTVHLDLVSYARRFAFESSCNFLF